MLKAFIEKIESMAAPKTYDVQGGYLLQQGTA